MLREVGRKATFYMLKYVKNNCKGGKILHIAKLNGRVCGAKRPHSVFEQSICYLPV